MENLHSKAADNAAILHSVAITYGAGNVERQLAQRSQSALTL